MGGTAESDHKQRGTKRGIGQTQEGLGNQDMAASTRASQKSKKRIRKKPSRRRVAIGKGTQHRKITGGTTTWTKGGRKGRR